MSDIVREARLCYATEGWAWFTTKDVREQWGDDWDDAPYEHNAGRPYGPTVYHHSDGTSTKDAEDWHDDGSPRWRLVKVAWDGPLDLPCEGHFNSPYSVQDINAGAVAWLRRSRYAPAETPRVNIMAGTTLEDFIFTVGAVGGTVYLSRDLAREAA